jgi:type IX secretion system substrate protein
MKMTRTLLYIFLGLIAILSIAEAQPSDAYSQWVSGCELPQGVSNGNSVEIDKQGNVIVAGNYQRNIKLGELEFTSQKTNFFVAKYDTSGKLLWAKTSKCDENAFSYGMCLDSNDNIYLTGQFRDSIWFNDDVVLRRSDSVDMFIAKLDSEGNFLRAIGVGGPGLESGQSIACDSESNLVVCGSHSAMSRFGKFDIVSYGSIDGFVARLNTQEKEWTWTWAETIGGTQVDVASAICVDEQGTSYLTGYCMDTCNIGNDFFPKPLPGINISAFVYSLTQDQEKNFVRLAYASAEKPVKLSIGWDITYSNNSIYVAGNFEDKIWVPNDEDYDAIGQDGFLWKMSNAGTHEYFLITGGYGNESAVSVAVNSKDEAFMGGYFTDTFAGLPAKNNIDLYLAKLDPNAQPLWIKRAGGESYSVPDLAEMPYSIAVSENLNYTNVYSTGNVFQNADFDENHYLYTGLAEKSGYFLWKQIDSKSMLTLETKNISALQSNKLDIIISADSSLYLEGCGADTIFADLSFNYSLLFPLNEGPGTVKGNMRTIPLVMPIKDLLDNSFKIPVIAGLGNDSTTKLKLSNISYNKGFLPVAEPINGTYKLLDVCYDGSKPRLIEPTGYKTYPNPTVSSITVQYSGDISSSISYSLVDLKGRSVLKNISYDQSAGEHKLILSPKPMPGMYFLIIRNGEQMLSEPIEITR